MSLSERQQLILSKLDECLSPGYLLQNPFLISRISPRNSLSPATVASLPSFLKLNATESELIHCTARCRFADLVEEFRAVAICPRFVIHPSTLIVWGVCDRLWEFEFFVRFISGNNRFRAAQFFERVALYFERAEDAMAVWRALRIVPFRGQFLRVSVYSIVFQIPRAASLDGARQKAIIVELPSKVRPVLGFSKVRELA
jgi:hypothetical protein